MKKHLTKLRAKSDEEKSHIVRTAALVTTGLVALGYILILAFAPRTPQSETSAQPQFFDTFSEILNTGFDQLGAIGSDIQEQRENLDLSPENLEALQQQLDQEPTLGNTTQELTEPVVEPGEGNALEETSTSDTVITADTNTIE